jgi:carboxymethylenebutenolidase
VIRPLIGRAAVALVLVAPSLSAQQQRPPEDPHAEHAAHAAHAPAGGVRPSQQQTGIPAGAAEAKARVDASPRHHEYVKIATSPGSRDSIAAWVVFPERATKAPVVVVIHEIFGLTTWIRGVADQLAADGFIAIAPDLMTGKIDPSVPDSNPRLATQVIRTLDPQVVQAQLTAVGEWGLKLPAAAGKSYGVVGFCWGGSTSFMQAVSNPDLGAAVVYYGSSPAAADLQRVRAPVLGLYGADDARVNVTVAPADSTLKALGRSFEYHFFEGAGHGFLRAQDQREGANLKAAQAAWPMTVAFFRKHLGA